MQARLHRQVARGPDVGAAFGEQQVNLGRPAPDPLDLRKLCNRRFIVSGQRAEIEFARRHQFAQAAQVALLLARQAARAQRVEIGGEDFGGRQVGAGKCLKLVPHRGRRGHADLLADDRAHQRFVPARADPRFGIAGNLQRAGHSRLQRGHGVEAVPDLLCAQSHALNPIAGPACQIPARRLAAAPQREQAQIAKGSPPNAQAGSRQSRWK